MRVLSAVAGTSLLVVASVALAGPQLRGGVAPVPESPRPASKAPVDAYLNPGSGPQLYYEGQAGAEAIDDVHAAEPGPYTKVSFEVYEPTPASTFDADVTLYGNPFGDDSDLQPLAGPFTATGLTTGSQAVEIVFPQPIDTGPDLWIGVRFTSDTAGLLLNDTPTVGLSHDLYVENGRMYWFGGSPVANFALGLTSESVSTAVPPAPAVGGRLLGNWPNPFNPATAVEYEIDVETDAELAIFDGRGVRVATLVQWGGHRPGRFQARWNGADRAGRPCASGVYHVRLSLSGGGTVSRSMVLVR